MAVMKFVGARVKRVEDARFLKGRAQYVDDIRVPGTLHMAFARSTHAHALIKRIDVRQAAAGAGVRRVFTCSDLAGKLELMGGALRTEVHPSFKASKWPCLATGKVRYVGEPVAVVIAESRYLAEDAAELVEVEYEVLPVVVDPERATMPNAPLLHEELGSNVVMQFAAGSGDVEGAFRRAAFVLKERFRTNRHGAIPLETRATLAAVDVDGDITLWTSTQVPHVVRKRVADVIRIRESKLRVISPDVGGGFGLKANVFPEEVLTCFVVQQMQVPVKWTEDRREHLLSSLHAKDDRIDCEMGFTSDGIVCGLRARVLGDVGAYSADPWSSVLESLQIAGALPGPYKHQDYNCEVVVACTNKTTLSVYRGVGVPAAVMVQEQLFDQAARRLDMDPADIRRKNLIPPSEFPYQSASGENYDSSSSTDALNQALEMMDYQGFRRRQAASRKQGQYVGIGICSYIEGAGFGKGFDMLLGTPHSTYEAANVRMDAHGGVEVAVGTHSHGQGHHTVYAQIVADELGIDVSEVRFTQGDTQATPQGWGTWGSRSVICGGGAIAGAARKVKEKMLRIAAQLLEVSPADLEVVPGHVQVKGVPSKAIAVKEIAQIAIWEFWRRPEGEGPGLEVSYYYDPPTATYSNATHVAEVEVDIHTGMVTLRRYGVIEDCGKIINPMIVDAQVVGGIAQGIGTALYEHYRYDENGQLLTTSFMDYLIPTAADVPDVQIEHIETLSPLTVDGVKGMGEAGTIGSPAAIVNAVADALAPFDVKITELPLTPERVWQLAQPSLA